MPVQCEDSVSVECVVVWDKKTWHASVIAHLGIGTPGSPSTFHIPQCVTPNDAKRQAWFADLANPTVLLHKLSKCIPHGVKGQDLLDLLHANTIATPRALAAWFLCVFGANEVTSLHHNPQPTYNPMQCSVEWENVIMSRLKKQLGDIAFPSAPCPTLNIKSMF